MFTKPKNAYSLTHTIIWDILYCYSTTVQARLYRQQIHWIVRELFPLCFAPRPGAVIPGPLQGHHMVDVDVTGVLYYVAGEHADPAACNHSAAALVRKPYGRR